MKSLSDIETTASTTIHDENADQYPILVDGGHRIFVRATAPTGVGEANGDIWIQTP